MYKNKYIVIVNKKQQKLYIKRMNEITTNQQGFFSSKKISKIDLDIFFLFLLRVKIWAQQNNNNYVLPQLIGLYNLQKRVVLGQQRKKSSVVFTGEQISVILLNHKGRQKIVVLNALLVLIFYKRIYSQQFLFINKHHVLYKFIYDLHIIRDKIILLIYIIINQSSCIRSNVCCTIQYNITLYFIGIFHHTTYYGFFWDVLGKMQQQVEHFVHVSSVCNIIYLAYHIIYNACISCINQCYGNGYANYYYKYAKFVTHLVECNLVIRGCYQLQQQQQSNYEFVILVIICNKIGVHRFAVSLRRKIYNYQS
eukprot:TRINITY_DN32236_c0_g1_i4.p1 TRINITY_DN32236_c0_g1~~TRINITY_DN32236_c0_g1_i4.p1  ORF type:complete len:309 (-),score=-21.53 TRINITY_DN32236_c0_g1_i4:442-1368(-)